MQRSEINAWSAVASLLAIALVLLAGGILYNNTAFWAGLMLAVPQALACGLAAWGLRLSRQRAELEQYPTTTGAAQTFRMSFANESGAPQAGTSESELKTLDTGFQRMLVAITALLLLVLAAGAAYIVYNTFGWARLHPDETVPIAGTFAKPGPFDELALVIGLAASAGYVLLYWLTRPRRGEGFRDSAVAGNLTLGLPGMIALGLAAIAGYLRIAYAAELAASIIAALLALQGLETLLNAFRSYSAIEELDQEAVDLHALPFVPMLTSNWISGLRLLLAQSVGISRGHEKSVMARMLPRAIIALIIIAVGVSCLRVVQPGRVAILERLGAAQRNADGTYALLYPGLHLCLPWPMDNLVTIPTQELQITDVGAELHGDKSLGKQLDFQFWTFRPDAKVEQADTTDQFVTGDPGSQQILETYVVILWRVADPDKFYNSLSHSAFYEKGAEETTAVPIYDALVQQCTNFAVTRTFAIHTLDEIMTTNRKEVEGHCKAILQQKLDQDGLGGKGCGIQVVDLTIKDLHPPLGVGDVPDPSQPDGIKRGPASAYENVVNAMQEKETRIKQAEAARDNLVNQANGEAATEVKGAEAERFDRVAKAQGEATRLTEMFSGVEQLPSGERQFMETLAKNQAMYTALKDILAPINKIVIDPKIPNVDLYQSGNGQNGGPARPPGP